MHTWSVGSLSRGWPLELFAGLISRTVRAASLLCADTMSDSVAAAASPMAPPARSQSVLLIATPHRCKTYLCRRHHMRFPPA